MTTPDLARTHIVEACGFQPRDDSSQVYRLENGQECLIGTAEIPLAGMYAGEMIDKSQLPHKMVAFSHCFRAEAGGGQQSHGLYRLHQFSKVEMLALTLGSQQESEAILHEFVAI